MPQPRCVLAMVQPHGDIPLSPQQFAPERPAQYIANSPRDNRFQYHSDNDKRGDILEAGAHYVFFGLG